MTLSVSRQLAAQSALRSSKVFMAMTIATVAHGAKGQKRADKTTPYIVHPARVVELLAGWYSTNHDDPMANEFIEGIDIERSLAAAWVHDVFEDTKLKIDDVSRWIDERTREIADLLTKKNAAHEPEDPAYYVGVAGDNEAIFVKCADRCANLEDALTEAKAGRELKRWWRYVERTKTDVLPVYASLPFLRRELQMRLDSIQELVCEGTSTPT